MAYEQSNLIEALYAALNSKYGVVLETNDPARLRQKLYQQRKALEDESLSVLRFSTSRTAPQSELLIVKTGTPHEQE